MPRGLMDATPSGCTHNISYRPSINEGLPRTPSSTHAEKYSRSLPISFLSASPPALSDERCTKVGATTPFSPLRALMILAANSAPAYAMESVAEPAPSLALTTSSPPYWMRFVSFSRSPCAKPDGRGEDDCDRSGTIYGRRFSHELCVHRTHIQ